MSTDTTRAEELALLRPLKIRGLLPLEALADSAGVTPPAAASALAQLSDAGLVSEMEGRMSGFMLTPDGRAREDVLFEAERESVEDHQALEEADRHFLAANEPFKQLCTKWQDEAPDERDRDAYGAAVSEVHAEGQQAVAAAARAVPRFAQYGERLDKALARFRDGDDSALLGVMKESYHDVWMELHHDLLAIQGRERGAADGH